MSNCACVLSTRTELRRGVTANISWTLPRGHSVLGTLLILGGCGCRLMEAGVDTIEW